MSLLSVRGMEAGYGSKPVLFDASIRLEQREIVLVVGPNGSGKSTLLRTIFGQCNVHSAREFCYNGHDLRGASLKSRMYAGLAYTPQHNNVFGRLTVRENLALPIELRGNSSVKDCLEEILENIPELISMQGKTAGQLSGGQRQLLALAMGLSLRPQLLLLDEPLAGLDDRTVGKVGRIIHRYNHDYGTAFLIVEHRFTKLVDLADRCYGMRLGKTVIDLDKAQLRNSFEFDSALRQVFMY